MTALRLQLQSGVSVATTTYPAKFKIFTIQVLMEKKIKVFQPLGQHWVTESVEARGSMISSPLQTAGFGSCGAIDWRCYKTCILECDKCFMSARSSLFPFFFFSVFNLNFIHTDATWYLSLLPTVLMNILLYGFRWKWWLRKTVSKVMPDPWFRKPECLVSYMPFPFVYKIIICNSQRCLLFIHCI